MTDDAKEALEAKEAFVEALDQIDFTEILRKVMTENFILGRYEKEPEEPGWEK